VDAGALSHSTLAGPPGFSWRAALLGLAACVLFAVSLVGARDPLIARSAAVAGICLVLWLSGLVPPYVPTLLLWIATPLLLQPFGDEFGLSRVLGWSADPVLVLFLGGFALGAAATRYGIDATIARAAVGMSRGHRLALVALTAGTTAVLSMWMSNIAAAAMMLSALRPLLADLPEGDSLRRALLLGIALGADFGGIATPIGSGPNAIAISVVSRVHTITFLEWMAFALPLSLGLVAASIALLALRYRLRGKISLRLPPPAAAVPGARIVVVLFFLTVGAWLTEPLHGVSSAIVALAVTVALFGTGLLDRGDLARIDWSTLILIAGGIGLGRLLEQSGLVRAAADAVPWADLSRPVQLLLLTFAAALLSALMSNTATATMLIPLAASLDPAPSTAVLIAIAASLGMPFVISTPPNAMVYGEGGLRQGDLLVPGLILMILGCLLVSATGPFVLGLMGIP
jgi:sodium-dependent dicarboxylate transporter 2/3/5